MIRLKSFFDQKRQGVYGLAQICKVGKFDAYSKKMNAFRRPICL